MSKLSFKTKSLLILIVALILGAMICPSIFVSHGSAYADGVEYNNYYFSDYHIDLEYDYENNVKVTERMTVVYGKPVDGTHKGIVRAIPSTTYISRGAVSDDYKRKLGVKITNVASNKLYDFYEEDGVYCIELGGDKDINEHGSVAEDYVITYTVKIGDDFTRDFDYVYYNVFGTDYPVAIKNATFSITMPEDIPNDMVYYVGKKGSGDAITLAKQSLSNGKVKFEIATPIDLEAYEGVSVKTILNEGYFKGLSEVITKLSGVNTIIIVVSVVAVFVLIIVYVMFGQKRKKCVETVEFYPPDGLNPAECCYLYNGQSNKMSSMFVYWASKGYLKIELDDDKKPKGVRKLQNIPEHLSESEKLAFNKLFENTDYVDITKQNDEIAKTFSASELMIKTSIGKRNSERSTNFKWWTILLSIAILVIAAVVECIFNNIETLYIMEMWFLAFGIGLIVVGLGEMVLNYLAGTKLLGFSLDMKISKQTKLTVLIFYVLGVGAVVVVNIVLSHMMALSIWTRLLASVPLIVSLICRPLATEYNDKWRDTIGRIKGFRNNLLLVEADKLQKLVDDDPEYFYNILPYAYAFGITEKFIEKFEHLTIPYNDNFGTMIDIAYFSMLRNTLSTFSHVPSSYSGGGIGGGVSGSGGGIGGGGSFGR